MSSADDAMFELVDAVIATFRQLRVVGGRLHGKDGPVTGERGILLQLASDGAQTVPSMARERSTSRQHVQVIVDRLAERGLVERRPNPRHKRSVVIALTRAGRAEVVRMRQRERRLAAGLAGSLSAADMQRAAATVRALGERLLAAVPGGQR